MIDQNDSRVEIQSHHLEKSLQRKNRLCAVCKSLYHLFWYRLVCGICRQRYCNKQLHGMIVMNEAWISSHIMEYLLHMAKLNKVDGVNLLRMAIEFIRANPYMIRKINCKGLYNLYNTNNVIVILPHDKVVNLLSSRTNSFYLWRCIPGVFNRFAGED